MSVHNPLINGGCLHSHWLMYPLYDTSNNITTNDHTNSSKNGNSNDDDRNENHMKNTRVNMKKMVDSG